MFKFLKKKQYDDKIAAPLKGAAVPISEVNDPAFAEEMLGKGMAIKPIEGKVYAPFDGVVSLVFDTKHAVSLVSEKGAEVLIHIGLDTVMLNGVYYTVYVEVGEAVKKGDLLMEFDIEAIKTAGYDTITPVLVCNADDYKDVVRTTGKMVEPGDVIIELEK